MTNAGKQRLVRMETQASFPFFIKIHYDDGNGNEIVENYVNCDEQKVFDGETYQPAYFIVKPPSRSNSTVTDGQLTLSTVDQSWIVKVRNAQKRMKCEVVGAMIYDTQGGYTIESIEESSFTMVRASWNEETMSFALMFDDRMNLQVPMDIATTIKVTGME